MGRSRDPSPTTTVFLSGALKSHLDRELGDRRQAAWLARWIARELLSWRVPTGELANTVGVIAFSFGNRVLATGATAPGPVNRELARLVVQIFRRTECRVFAQWEIAECIGTAMPPDRLCSITQDLSGDGCSLKYLSTKDVILKIKGKLGRLRSPRHILVVAHRDHAYRCLALLRQHGIIQAFVPPFPLPRGYDRLSGQPWTRSRHRYLIHELLARLADYRAGL